MHAPLLSRLGLGVLVLSLAWATLPLGSNRPWALAITLPVLLALALAVTWRRPASAGAAFAGWLVRPPGLLVAGFLLLLLAQWLPLAGGEPLSIVPARTLAFLQMAFGCAVTAWLVTRLVRSAGDVRLLLYGLVGIGLLQAVLAAVLLATGAVVPLFDSEVANTGVASGTFANRNHFAACLNMALSAGIGLLMGGLSSTGEPLGWRQRLRGWLELVFSGKARLRLLLVLLVVMLIATRSRMGNSAFFIGLLLSASVYALFARRRQRGLWLFVASLVVVDVALIGAWVGVDKVVERVQATHLLRDAQAPAAVSSRLPDLPVEERPASAQPAAAAAPDAAAPDAAAPVRAAEQSIEDRTDPAFDALALVRERPWLGSGAGTFYVAYMAHARKDMGFYNHAHNDYLEAAADTGLVGLGLLLTLGVWSFAAALRILRTRQNPDVRAAAFASIMATACLALHSFVEFSLQIPANAWLFSALLALPFAAAAVPSGRRRSSVRGSAGAAAAAPPLPLAAHLPLALAASVALLASGWTTLRLGLADYAAIGANSQMTLWEQGEMPMTLGGLETVERSLARAISIAPENPEFYEALGNVWFARAVFEDDAAAAADANAATPPRTAEQRRQDLQAAAARYRQAVARNRASPYAWSSLLAAKSRLGERDEEFRLALASAARFGPYEPNVQATLVAAGLAAWPELSVDERRLVAQTVTRGWPTNRDRLAAVARDDDFPAHWCDLSPQRRPLVDSPPDVMNVMLGLCRIAASLEITGK